MRAIQINSPAKLNLYLDALYKRPDGYHQIQTVFERVSLSDSIVLERRRCKTIRIFCSEPGVPCNQDNLCYKAARLLQKEYRVACGADIHIEKRIPVASGLAGGSSNAASVLLGLNKLWRLELDKYALIDHGRHIGSDTAFFLYDVSFAFAAGRGEEVYPIAANHTFWHIIAAPPIKIYTPDVYRNLKLANSPPAGKNLAPSAPTRARHTNVLTKPLADVNILIYGLRSGGVDALNSALYNCLEAPALKLDKTGLILKTKNEFKKLGLRPLMTGSGPAVFGILETRKEAEGLARKFRQRRVFVVSTF